MKKQLKTYMTFFACAAFAAGAFSAAGGMLLEAEAAEMTAQRSYDVSRVALPEEAERLVVVEAEGLSANVSMYVKTAADTGHAQELGARSGGETDGAQASQAADAAADSASAWQLIVSTDEGLIGRKGMGKVKEGDEKTPAGLYRMNTPFGTSAAQAGFPENYLQVDSRYYWNGDSESDRYNKLVNTDEYNAFNKSKSEHLSTYGGIAYNYCIDTGYNFDGTPYKGSALFLHCSAGKNTAGCIAIPEASMVEIMKAYREGKTYILLDHKGNFEQYYRNEVITPEPVRMNAPEDPAVTAENEKKGPCVLSGSCA